MPALKRIPSGVDFAAPEEIRTPAPRFAVRRSKRLRSLLA